MSVTDNKAYEISEENELKVVSSVKEEKNVTEENKTLEHKSDLIYHVDDVPPWYMCLGLGFQHYLTMIGSTITIPFILAPKLCLPEGDPANGQLVSTILFVSGISTLLQTSLGIRLPIVQGGTFAFLLPAISLMKGSFPTCENATSEANLTLIEDWDLWTPRMRMIQGAVISASIFQVIFGVTGLIGVLLSWISPLTIVPTISLVGLALFKEGANAASGDWRISLLTVFFLVIFSQYLPQLDVSRKGKLSKVIKVFKLFPVILSILISWALCAILTASGALEEGSPARTDNKLSVISQSPWLYVPYPLQWGTPIFTVSGTIGFLAGVVASAIESIGDYYACARLSGVKLPPTHAINRGVTIEGIGCILAGLLGSGNGTTSYSENIGAIRITRVASRRVIQFGAVFMIGLAVFGKVGALFVTLPGPLVGGVLMVMFGVISGVGLSNLQLVDLGSTRNVFVLGVSLFFGLAIPEWVDRNSSSISTGYPDLDQVLVVLLRTHMFVGGLLGMFLDNTIPGTDEERGMIAWKSGRYSTDEYNKSNTYDLPLGMNLIKRYSWLKKFPISPTYVPKKFKNYLKIWWEKRKAQNHS